MSRFADDDTASLLRLERFFKRNDAAIRVNRLSSSSSAAFFHWVNNSSGRDETVKDIVRSLPAVGGTTNNNNYYSSATRSRRMNGSVRKTRRVDDEDAARLMEFGVITLTPKWSIEFFFFAPPSRDGIRFWIYSISEEVEV